jgi:Zn-dependent protease with chaperone function
VAKVIVIILAGVIYIGVTAVVMGISRKRERVSDVGMIVMLTGITIES